MLRVVFLDFDGVIKESLDMKTSAFAALFAPWGEDAVTAVRAHHIANGGMSRYRKIPLYLREFCKTDASEALVQRLLADFAARVVEDVVASPFVAGAEDFMHDCTRRGIPIAVVSGTPEEEMRAIAARMGYDRRFARVYGSPRDKNELLALAQQDFSCAPPDALFVGDSINDYLPAQALGVPYIARARAGAPDPFPESTIRIADFTGQTAGDLYARACAQGAL
jgi:phosphoglycolate phosphatase-like HAD superfamily hydrolase